MKRLSLVILLCILGSLAFCVNGSFFQRFPPSYNVNLGEMSGPHTGEWQRGSRPNNYYGPNYYDDDMIYTLGASNTNSPEPVYGVLYKASLFNDLFISSSSPSSYKEFEVEIMVRYMKKNNAESYTYTDLQVFSDENLTQPVPSSNGYVILNSLNPSLYFEVPLKPDVNNVPYNCWVDIMIKRDNDISHLTSNNDYSASFELSMMELDSEGNRIGAWESYFIDLKGYYGTDDPPSNYTLSINDYNCDDIPVNNINLLWNNFYEVANINFESSTSFKLSSLGDYSIVISPSDDKDNLANRTFKFRLKDSTDENINTTCNYEVRVFDENNNEVVLRGNESLLNRTLHIPAKQLGYVPQSSNYAWALKYNTPLQIRLLGFGSTRYNLDDFAEGIYESSIFIHVVGN